MTVRQSTGFISDLASVGARMVLDRGGSGKTIIPVLAYTLVPSLVFGRPGGEMTSALVSALLTNGFQMSFTASYREILQHAVPARDTCACTVKDGGEIQLRIDGRLMHSQQLDGTYVDDAAWLEAATSGHVLVISGDNLMFTDADLDLTAAARLGTLVTGIVPLLV